MRLPYWVTLVPRGGEPEGDWGQGHGGTGRLGLLNLMGGQIIVVSKQWLFWYTRTDHWPLGVRVFSLYIYIVMHRLFGWVI